MSRTSKSHRERLPQRPPSERRGDPIHTPTDEGEAIERLLRLAEPRPAVPDTTENRVRKVTREAWRVRLAQTRRRKLWAGITLAAAASLAAVLLVVPDRRPADVAAPERLALLSAATGRVTRTAPDADGERRLYPGEPLYTDDRIETGPGARVALTLAGGASLRLDHETSLRLLSRRSLLLENGGIYFDSADRPPDSETIEVRTDLGVVRDIGTQFEVRRDAARPEALLSVRVREGQIEYDWNGASHEAGAGFELRLSEAGELSRHATPLFGPSWEWILDVAPSFDLEGDTLEAFLDWVSRETGWKTEFADTTLAGSASGVVLHGSIEGLRPDSALEAVLPTCGLEYRLDGGILRIEAETR